MQDLVGSMASSLSGFHDDPAGRLTACRKMVERHPTKGPLWWMSARVITAADPVDEAWRCLDEWVSDPTITELGFALPEGAKALVVGAPERLVGAFASRGDVAVTVVDTDGCCGPFVADLEAAEVDVTRIDLMDMGQAIAVADLLVLDASAVGPTGLFAEAGSWPAAAVAHTSGVAVWAVAGVGRVLRAGVWTAIGERSAGTRGFEVVPMELIDQVVGPVGPARAQDAALTSDSPDAPELAH